MSRRSKRTKKGDEVASSTGDSGVNEQGVVPEQKNVKKEEKRIIPSQNVEGKGGNTKGRGRGRRDKAGGASNSAASNQFEETKSIQATSLVANANRIRTTGVQEILRKANSSTLSSYKIPKKFGSSTITEGSPPEVLATSTNMPNPLVKLENGVGQRKRKSVGDADADANQNKRCRSGSSSVDSVKEKPPEIETEVQMPPEPVNITPKCRPRLTATRSKANASKSTTEVTQIDTPQMAFLRERLANKNKNKKGNEVDVQNRKQRQRQQITPRTPTPARRLPVVSPLEPTTSWRSTENISSSTAVADGALATNFQNPVLEVMQSAKDDPESNFQVDMFDEMDVDIIPTSTQSKQPLVIFDTNVWINCRNLIQQVLEMEITLPTESVNAMVVIPWMVLQEIDRGKGSNSGVTAFRSASKYIHSLLAAKHPRVKGQKATEAIISMEFNELMADDSILNCAVQCSKLPHFQTVLVTNDINLLNKALVHNLDAFKADNSLLVSLQSLFNEQKNIISELETPSRPVDTCSNSFLVQQPSFCSSPYPSTASNTLNHSVQTDDVEDIGMEVDDPMGGDDVLTRDKEISFKSQQQDVLMEPPTFEAVAKSLQQALTTIIVPKMIEDYGIDGWKFAIKIMPPFTVESGLKCIEAHWIAVFSYVFSPRGKDALDELLKLFQQKPQAIDESKQWRLNICQLAKVLLSLNDKVAEKPLASKCILLLQAYIHFESV